MTTKANVAASAPAKRKRKRGQITLGRHDEMVIEAMYRLGGVTVQQIIRATSVGSLTAARECLRRLQASGLVEQTQDTSRWRDKAAMGGVPPSFYYLSKGQAQRAIEYGGFLAGVERRKEALAGYHWHQLPARAAHSSIRNEYFLRLLEDTDTADAEISWEMLWGESHPDHPLLAGEISRDKLGKAPRANARRNPRRRLYPDGSFEVEFEGLEPVTMMLEVEATRTRGEKLTKKVGDYAGWMHMEEILRPLIIVARTTRLADGMRKVVQDRVRKGARGQSRDSEAVAYYVAWIKELRKKGVQPGRLIVFVSAEEVQEAGAYEAIYRPLAVEEPGGESSGITLQEVARRTLEAREKLGIEEAA